jgi:membrane protease subunit HflK
MAWNEPGDHGKPNDPWGGGNRKPGPPDLDKILSQFIQKLRLLLKLKPMGSGGSNQFHSASSKDVGFGIGVIVLVALVGWFLAGLFIVNPAEQAVILRLGKYTDTLDPGLHWMARFIDTKYLVDVQKVYSFSLQGEFLTKSSEQGDLPNQVVPTTANNISAATVDLTDKSKNLVDVELAVQYRISDPKAYLFNVVNPDDTIQQAAAGALSDVIGKMKLDDVLTTGRELLSSNVLEQLRHILQTYNAGFDVVSVTLRRVQAPDQVRAAFNDVNRADQDRATYIQQAQAYASKVVPLARGVAARITADATAYQRQAVLTAQAQVASYQALLNAYTLSPDLTRERLYLQAMQTIFQNTSKVLVDLNSSNNMLYLPIDKVMQSVVPTPVSPISPVSGSSSNQNPSVGTEVKS